MPDPIDPTHVDSGGIATSSSDSLRPGSGSQSSAPNEQVELPYPEELQAMLGGAYVIESFLGQGGMGAVYKGLQMPLRRPVAVKILAKGVGEDYGFEERFKREAYAMAALTHPHIVQVYDCGDAGEQFLFISMELVEGGDLSDALKAQQVTPEVALKLMPQICDGLQAAHERGIVHRDIKPANIFLTSDGRAKVADFGLAKKFSGAATMVTKTGLGLGTPDYAAPEQYENLPDIDHRADIYSLGVMFYQLLTGRLPRGAWKAPSSRAGTDPRLDDVVLKAMESDRDERYQTVEQFKQDILRITTQASSQTVSRAVPVQPMNTAAVPVARPSPSAPLATRTAAVPAARPTGPAGASRTGSVPARPRTQGVATGGRPGASAPEKKPLPVNLIAGIFLAAVVAAGGLWMWLKKPGGGTEKGVVQLLDREEHQGRPVAGSWTRDAAGMLGAQLPSQPGMKDEERMPLYQTDYVPPEEYDFEMEFTRKGGVILQVLAGWGTAFTHEFTSSSSDSQSTRIGVQRIDERDIYSARDGFAMGLPPARNGGRHVAVVRVRRDSISSTLDGQEVFQVKEGFDRLNLHPSYGRFRAGRLGFGARNGDIVVHRATVREISGPGAFIEPEAVASIPGTGAGVTAAGLKPLTDWAFALKGFIVVRNGGFNVRVTKDSEMPASCDRVVEFEVPGTRPAERMAPEALKVLLTLTDLARLVPRKCGLTVQECSQLIAHNPKLTVLSFEGNEITDGIVDDVVRLPLLETLNLGYAKGITGAGFGKLTALSRLFSLSVNDTSLTDAGLAEICHIKTLRSLIVTSTKVTGAGLGKVAALRDLETLSFRYTDVKPAVVQSLASLAKLKHIEVAFGRGFSDMSELVAVGKTFPNLKEYIVDFGNGETEKKYAPQMARISELAVLPGLTKVEMWGCNNSDASLISGLDKFDQLTYLNIGAKFDEEDLKLLKGLPLLINLRLGGADLSEFGALNLMSTVPNLREINRGAFSEAGLKAFIENFPQVKLVDG